MRTIVMAQGHGFYGMAFFTVDLPLRDVSAYLSKEPGPGLTGDRLYLEYPPDTSVCVKAWEGESQPDPIMLYDSGHGAIDLYILNHLKRRIEAQTIWRRDVRESSPQRETEVRDLEAEGFVRCPPPPTGRPSKNEV